MDQVLPGDLKEAFCSQVVSPLGMLAEGNAVLGAPVMEWLVVCLVQAQSHGLAVVGCVP